MDPERDITQIVRSWLRTDEHESAGRILDDVLAVVDIKTQRPAAWSVNQLVFSGLSKGTRMNHPIRLLIAAAAIVVVAVVGINLLPSSIGVGGPSTTKDASQNAPGSFEVPWSQGRIRLTMPPGWFESSPETCANVCVRPAGGTTITRLDRVGGSLLGLSLVHDVTQVVADICLAPGQQRFVDVGPTVEDLTTALVNQVGGPRSGPEDVTLGGYPAKKFVLTLRGLCVGPDAKQVWANRTSGGFWALKGGTSTIYIVDVDGDRLVITSVERGAPAADLAQLDAIVASIEIERLFSLSSTGRNRFTVDGVPLSFSAPTGPDGWTSGPIEKTPVGGFRNTGLYISKSITGPQGAEEVIYWTAFPDGAHADPCGPLLSPSIGPSAADLAAVLSTAPGIELVSPPSDVSVGGRAAKHLVLTVGADLGCDPGYFFTWPSECWGPCWMTTDVGTTIRVWVLDWQGTLFLIVGETHNQARPGFALSDAAQARLDQEIQQIVDSIQFE